MEGNPPVSPYQLKSDPYSSHSVIIRQIGPGNGRRVLDVGAASGYLAQLLADRGFEVTGVEGDPVLAQEAAKHCREVISADLDEPLPPLSGTFDVIIFGDVLEHLKQPVRVLREISQHLATNGLIIISVPNVAHAYVRLNLLLGRFNYADRGILDRTHLRFFTLQTFKTFLDEAGLVAEKITGTPVPLPLVVPQRFQGRTFGMLHEFSARVANAWKTLFGYQFVAIARKR